MKNFWLSVANNIMVAFGFITADHLTSKSIVLGVIAFGIAYAILDLHSYFDKKMDYPNNIFIH